MERPENISKEIQNQLVSQCMQLNGLRKIW